MKPLEGKVIITTQPADQSQTLVELLTERGAGALNLPMIETHTLLLPAAQVKEMLHSERFRLLVFTSKKGVKGFFENLWHQQNNYRFPHPVQIAVVGHGTAECLKNYGHEASFINPGNDAQDLAQYLLSEVIQPQDNILLALGNRAPDFLEKNLAQKANIKRVNVYETILLTEIDQMMADKIRQRKTDMCIFTSPSGFSAFKDLFGNLNALPLAAIGNTTARAIKDSGYEVAVIAPQPTPEAMVIALEEYFSGKT
ncbi:MAG: uroporphyrinogen-III synthase [Bacteroidetes bacterium]|nr:MAG: uroporphyrinogen-III synthase [Bacteroidota bacterium]